MKKFLSFLAGSAGLLINKEKTFLNFAEQFLKYAPVSYTKLSPYFKDLVNKIFILSKEYHLSLADEVDLLELILKNCVLFIKKEEYQYLPLNFQVQEIQKLPLPSNFMAIDFLEEHSIKY